MASNSGTNKRRRTIADILHISDLPIGFIVNVATYLPKPSRAILAAAFSAPSTSWKNDNLMHRLPAISTAIVSAQQWDTLDFEDINKKLANKLTDDDIYAVLKSIDAHDVLKRLKLCGCTNITGIGLNPLRGSVVLEQIDFSLVGKHGIFNCHPQLQSKILEEAVVPILDSIISSNGCSLKHVMFPPEWRGSNAHAESESLNQFRQRYNILYNSRRLNCSKCNSEMDNIVWMRMLQYNVCYDCLKPFCDNCTDNDEDEEHGALNFCGRCDKDFCLDCVPTTECIGCQETMLCGCAGRTCQQCNETKCKECLHTCDGCNRSRCDDCFTYYQCEGINCDKAHCSDCYDGKEYDIKFCEECDSAFCFCCNLGLIKKHGVECRACAPETVPLTMMLDEIAKHKEEMAKLRKASGLEVNIH